VLTTSGTLGTLLFAFSALVVKSKTLSLATPPRIVVIISLVFFLIAEIAGIFTNWPHPWAPIDESNLSRLLDPNLWVAPPSPAARRVAEAKIDILKDSRQLNNARGLLLLIAMSMEVLAVLALACGVVMILMG
jgi:hypothetical protein